MNISPCLCGDPCCKRCFPSGCGEKGCQHCDRPDEPDPPEIDEPECDRCHHSLAKHDLGGDGRMCGSHICGCTGFVPERSKNMTREEFLYRLGQTPRVWTVDHNGRIQTRDGWHTPMSAVIEERRGNRLGPKSLRLTDGLAIGLSREDCDAIEWSSSNRLYLPELRFRLLIACGVSDPQAAKDGANRAAVGLDPEPKP